MREFKDPYYTGEPCKCCTPKPENVAASIDAVAERLELLGIELGVIRERIDAVRDKLVILEMEIKNGD